MIYDVAVLGLGPAGLAATIYARRYNLNTITLGKQIGGLVTEASFVENYPGFLQTSGIELTNKFKEQTERLNAEILEEEIVNVEKKDNFLIQTDKNQIFQAKSLIIALGTKKRKLNINGEEKFLGKGVSYCPICDAPFFIDKTVAVIGGRDSAAHTALLLAEKSKKVYIIYRREKLRAQPFLIEKVMQNKKIEIIYNSLPVEIKGNNLVESLIIDKKNKKQEIKLNGIFVEIGSIPSTNLIKKLKINLDKENYIQVKQDMSTNIPGVFAAGDITTTPLRQIVTAAAQGAIAASSAYAYLKNSKDL